MYGHSALYHKDVPRGAAYSFSFPAPRFFSAPGRILTFPISCAPLFLSPERIPPFSLSCAPLFLMPGRIPPFSLSCAPLSSLAGADSTLFHLFRPAFFSRRGTFHRFPSPTPRSFLAPGRIPSFPGAYAPRITPRKKSPRSASTRSHCPRHSHREALASAAD